jgi:hypothetical protein
VIFQVDLFNARMGRCRAHCWKPAEREKDIRYASRSEHNDRTGA